MVGTFTYCVRCNKPLDLTEGELHTVFCSTCRDAELRTRNDVTLSPHMRAFLIVNDKRLEVIREAGRITPAARILRRVSDYLDAVSEVEEMEWPDEIL